MRRDAIEKAGACRHPTSMPELEEAEQLLLWCVRRLAAGTQEWTMVERELARQLGQMDGLWAMRSAIALMSRLARGARRRLRCHKPCCAMLAPDEVSILLIVAAAAHGERALARTFANWLVRGQAVEELLEVAERLGAFLIAAGLSLPLRGTTVCAPAQRHMPVRPTWH